MLSVKRCADKATETGGPLGSETKQKSLTAVFGGGYSVPADLTKVQNAAFSVSKHRGKTGNRDRSAADWFGEPRNVRQQVLKRSFVP